MGAASVLEDRATNVILHKRSHQVLENKGFSTFGFDEKRHFFKNRTQLSKAQTRPKCKRQKQSHQDVRRMDGVTYWNY
jgi:hypothetical protein